MVQDTVVYRWMTSVLNSIIGGWLGGAGGFALGGWYVERYMPFAELEGIIPPLLGGSSGVIIGSIVGAASSAWVRGRFPARWLVSLLLAVVVLGVILLPAYLGTMAILVVLVVPGGIGLLVEGVRQARSHLGHSRRGDD